MSEIPTYVYGVAAAGVLRTPLRAQGMPDGQSPVTAIAVGGASAIVGPHAGPAMNGLPRPELLRRLAIHQRVIEDALERGDVLPAQFGTVLASEDEVRMFLTGWGGMVRASLARFSGLVEVEVAATWDLQRVLGDVAREAEWRQLALRPGEQIQVELYGSYHHTEGIWRVWRPGRLLLTDQRLLLIRPVPREILFAAQVSAVAGVGRIQRENIAGGRRDITCLALEDGTLAALYTAEPDVLEAFLADRLQRLGRTVTELSAADAGSLGFGAAAAGQLWHRWRPGDGQAQWKSGWAVLTADELTWRADVGPGVLLRVPLAQIGNLTVERRDLGNLGVRDVLVMSHEAGGRQAEALFTGENVSDWPEAIRRVAYPGDGDGDA